MNLGYLRFKPEPVLFLTSVSIGINVVLLQSFITYRLCCVGKINCDDSCLSRANDSDRYHFESQASRFAIFCQISSSLPAVFASFYFAVWSDKYGRKLPMLLTLVAFTIQNLFSIALATFHVLPLWLIFIGNVLCGLTGHAMVYYACCFSMITDTVEDKSRLTVEMGVASGLIYLGILVGSLLTGEIVKLSGRTFVYNFLFAAFATASAFFYSATVLQDTIGLRHRSENGDSIAKDVAGPEPENDHSVAVSLMEKPMKLVTEFLKVFYKQREDRRRLYLIIGVLCFLVTYACDVSLSGLQFLFLSNAPFHFSETEFGYQVAVQTSSAACGLFILPLLFERFLNVTDDLWFVMLGVLVTASKSILFAFAIHYWMVLSFSLLSFGAALIFTGYRSFCSKLVESNETARLFAVLSSVELLGPLLSSGFNLIYAYTVNFYAGLTWIVAGIVLVFVFVAICWVEIDIRRQKVNENCVFVDDTVPQYDEFVEPE